MVRPFLELGDTYFLKILKMTKAEHLRIPAGTVLSFQLKRVLTPRPW